ncbi:hypothetical protein [Lichenifustis flavocetrariae]|uniref:Uncharacterized protein n=1 Tax=Lichenifustis flavocetrariae TaxID=2949735 RepID=A0AA41YYI3_9HYPH|nr:hypothetical protein [Lichenifustis flavocetrariae]MCW6509562.1 hypothetical protein [Lichenifustis flavocetrariae]
MTYDTADSGTRDGRRTATAFFDSREAAERARTDLLGAGLQADAVTMLGDQRAAAEDAPILPEEGGFWHALKEFFIPDEDRFTYAEGLRRGGFVVSVHTDAANYDRALDILDADGAVDIDEREQAWRSEGWQGWQEGISPLGGPPDNSTAGFGASYAGEDGYQPLQPKSVPSEAATGSLTTAGGIESESRADASKVGTGPNEPGALNPDMRERIGSGTASMTPPTPTGPQDATLYDNAAALDRKAAIEDASLGSATRSGLEAPGTTSTIGRDAKTAPFESSASRRDTSVQRSRVRGFIVNPVDGA